MPRANQLGSISKVVLLSVSAIFSAVCVLTLAYISFVNPANRFKGTPNNNDSGFSVLLGSDLPARKNEVDLKFVQRDLLLDHFFGEKSKDDHTFRYACTFNHLNSSTRELSGDCEEVGAEKFVLADQFLFLCEAKDSLINNNRLYAVAKDTADEKSLGNVYLAVLDNLNIDETEKMKFISENYRNLFYTVGIINEGMDEFGPSGKVDFLNVFVDTASECPF